MAIVMPDFRDDERKIVELTVRYATAIDDRQEDRLLECFTEDDVPDHGPPDARAHRRAHGQHPCRNGRHVTPFMQPCRNGRRLGCTLPLPFLGTAYWRDGVGLRFATCTADTKTSSSAPTRDGASTHGASPSYTRLRA